MSKYDVAIDSRVLKRIESLGESKEEAKTQINRIDRLIKEIIPNKTKMYTTNCWDDVFKHVITKIVNANGDVKVKDLSQDGVPQFKMNLSELSTLSEIKKMLPYLNYDDSRIDGYDI